MPRFAAACIAAVLALPSDSRANDDDESPDLYHISQAVYTCDRVWASTTGGSLLIADPRDGSTVEKKSLGNVVGLLRDPAGGVQFLALSGRTLKHGHLDCAKRVTSLIKLRIGARSEPFGLVAMRDSSVAVMSNELIVFADGALRRRVNLQTTLRTWGYASVAVSGTGKLYVGMNRGEWGGELNEVDPDSGKVEVVDLFSLLPVTGLVASPWEPECVYATYGLVHFSQDGHISKICHDADPMTVLHRPLAENSELMAQWRTEAGDPEDPQEDLAATLKDQNEAFFGIAQNSSEIRAVTCYGVYRIMRNGAERIGDLPDLNRRGSLRINADFAGIVYLGTGMNWEKSLSGMTPLILLTQP